MSHDAVFVTGYNHGICQDYALSCPERAVVADGCSSSPHTDCGARLLAWSHFQPQAQPLSQAMALARQLTLPPASLDATLGLLTRQETAIHATLHGDGWLLAMERTGGWQAWQISYDDNTPCYAIYDHPERRVLWPQPEPVRRVVHITACSQETTLTPWRQVERWSLAREDFSLVLLASDGLDAFHRLPGNQPVAALAIIPALLAFPNRQGEFVKRRLRRLLKQLAAENIHPMDDLALAVLAWD